MIKYLYIILAILTIYSCDKEIDIDYRDIAQLYVVEGVVDGTISSAKITKSRNMQQPETTDFVDNAIVKVTRNDGVSQTLESRGDGYYSMPDTTQFASFINNNYKFEVEVGEHNFSSTSQLYAPTEVVGHQYSWQPTMKNNESVLLAITIRDKFGEENYYHYQTFVNGEMHKWGVIKDFGRDGENINVNITFLDESQEDELKDDVIYVKDGDKIYTEIRTIDEGVYDYLYSVILGERTASNPIPNFDGGCLGYFSAYSTTNFTDTFYFDNVQD